MATKAELLSSIQEATIGLTQINLDDALIRALGEVDERIHSILDDALCAIVRGEIPPLLEYLPGHDKD